MFSQTVMEAAKDKGYEVARLVCMGLRWYTGEVSQWWQEYDVETREIIDNRSHSFTPAVVPIARPGSIYYVFVKRDGTGRISSVIPTKGKSDFNPSYFTTYHDTALLVLWRVLHEAAQTKQTLAKKERSNESLDKYKEALAPIREAMRSTDARGRRAIMVQVMEYLNAGLS